MTKRGKRSKRRLAKLRKRLGFVPSITRIPMPRFGSTQERIDQSGHACCLDKSKREIQESEDRAQKQKGWSE